MSRVLVTGGNGYLGTQVIAALLRQGREVRTTVRSVNSAPEIREALHRSGADDNGLEVVTADLTSDDGWATATAGVEEVHHVASPIPPAQPEDPDDAIIPARQGTLRVLRAAREAGARGVVLDLQLRRGRLLAQAGPRLHRRRLDRPRHPRPAALPALQNDRRARRLGTTSSSTQAAPNWSCSTRRLSSAPPWPPRCALPWSPSRRLPRAPCRRCRASVSAWPTCVMWPMPISRRRPRRTRPVKVPRCRPMG